jgi:hypothetical protein
LLRWRDLGIHANLSPELPFRQKLVTVVCPRCVGSPNAIGSGLVERIKGRRGKKRRMEALTKLTVLSLAAFRVSDEFRPAILWNPQSNKRNQNSAASCILTIDTGRPPTPLL